MEELAASFTELAARWSSPEAQLDTAAFVSASTGVAAVLHAVGGPAFAFASVDYVRKLDSLREACASRPECCTLDAIIAADEAAGTLSTQGSLSRNAWRVLNALRFCRELFQGVLPREGGDADAEDDVPLRTIVWTAYGARPLLLCCPVTPCVR
jgi:hypothetical protein